MSTLAEEGASQTKVVLTIAGSDSSCGAGMQADIKTFQDMDVYGMCAVTAITSQDASGVLSVRPLPPEIVAEQVDTVMRGFPVAAIKTGMLYSRDIVATVASLAAAWPRIAEHHLPLVVDPVLKAHTGASLGDGSLVVAIRELLMPLATVVTPNAVEAADLCRGTVETVADARQAAKDLCGMGADAAVVTGIVTPEGIADAYCYHGEVGHIALPRLTATSVHGTGCTFSAALASGLASGLLFVEALERAKWYTYRSIATALALGTGQLMSGHGCDII